MSSLTNENNYARSMNGLSTISANQVYTDDLSVGSLTTTTGINASTSQVINFGSNAPTMSGTNITGLPTSALPATIAYKNVANTFTNNNSFTSTTYFAGSPDAIIVQKTSTGGYIFLNNNGTIGYYNGATFNWSIDYSGNILSTGGLNLSSTQNINFGTNAPIMRGKNIDFTPIDDYTTTNISNSPYGTYSAPFSTNNNNVFIGQNICNYQNITNKITDNIFIGNNLAFDASYIRFNIGIGNNCLRNLQVGDGNLGYGLNALFSLKNGSANIAFGNQTLYNFTLGNYNFVAGSANGANCGTPTTSSIACSYNLLMGGGNIAFANDVSPNRTISNKNIAMGYGALSFVKTSTNDGIQLTSNVAIGYSALHGGDGGAGFVGLFGARNTAVGDSAGYYCCGTSSDCLFLGANTDVASQSTVYTKVTCIGAGVVASASNSINIGGTSETTFIKGSLNVTGASTFTTAPTMSGANISATSIPDSALSTNIPKLNAANTFAVAPTMSGANITAASIADSALSSNIVKLNSNNVYTGQNTYNNNVIFNKTTTFRDGVTTTSLRPSYQNPMWFYYPKVDPGPGIVKRYYFRPAINAGSDDITFDVDTVVKYYMVGNGGGGSGNCSTGARAGGGGGAGQLITGTFTASGGVVYTLTTYGAGTSTGSAGNATTVGQGGNGSIVSITTAGGFSLIAAGGFGGVAHTSSVRAGQGGNGGGAGLGGGLGGATTGLAGAAGTVSNGGAGGGGGSFNNATNAAGAVATATMTDGTVISISGGAGGSNVDTSSGFTATLWGGGGGGGGGLATQAGGNGWYGFIILELDPFGDETYHFNPTYGITPTVYANNRLIATTEYVKNQYALNNTFTNLVQVNVPNLVTPTTSTTGVNGSIQIVCNSNIGSVAKDAIGIKAGIDNNSIINFANTSGGLRGNINGPSGSAVAYNTTSDERLKENIVNIPSQLENIKSLSARAFNWKSTGELDNGFIAQEIYRVYPELNILKNNDKYEDKLYPVKSDGSDFIHTIDYGRMTPYLWSAVQELTLTVERQQKQIDDLIKLLNV